MEDKILEDEEIGALVDTHIETPAFPIFMFMGAIMKDLVDMISFGFLGWLTSLIFAFAVFLWALNKTGFVQKQIMRWIIKKVWLVVVSMLAEMIPFISAFFPGAILFVLFVHHREKKIVQFTLNAIEELYRLGKIKI